MYDQLNLREWPFRTTADDNFASIWAGRIETRNQVDRLLRKMLLFPKSGLYILWANFGMGKTHTLYHLRFRCKEAKNSPLLIPVYAVMPKRSTGFLELYREIVQELPYEFLRKQIQKLGSNIQGSVSLHPMFSRSPGVVKALLAITSEDIEASTTARQWLAAQPGLSKSDMNLIDVSYRIKTPEDALNALSALTNLACFDPNPTKQNKLLVMIDEYQRVGELKSRISGENNSSLHTFFNNHPNNLNLVLSFSFSKKENVQFLLSSELKSRAELLAIHLDILTPVEAVEFIHDLMSQFRILMDDRLSFPLSPEAEAYIIKYIASKKALTPRRLMLYFDHVLSQCVLDSDPGENGYEISQIQPFLDDPELGSLDIDAPE